MRPSLLLALLAGCSGAGSPADPEPVPGDTAPGDTADPAAEEHRLALPAPRLLRRLSLDLRGTLPDAEELAAAREDPEAVEAYAAAWLDGPALEERLVHLLAEQWHTRLEAFLILYRDYPAINDDPENEYAFERAVGEEPLRLAARVVAEDRSWAEVVTADHTVANELLASIWPLERDEGEGWTTARYTDGRPPLGILSTNGLWWRYFSTVSNYNRGRVAALTRMLVCVDYASRTISFSESDALAAGAQVEDALRESPPCMGCHAGIDPIAANLFGFWPANEYNVDEVDHYHPEREALGAELLGVEPAWYGDPVGAPAELGLHIARDPRFSRCAVDTFARGLWDRELDRADEPVLAELDVAFQAEDLRVKPLLAALLASPAYRVGGFAEGADEATRSREQTLRMLTPDQLSSAYAELAGFSWTWEGYEQLDNDALGFRILGGGVDGEEVGQPQRSPSLTTLLVAQRTAEAVAGQLVAADLEGGEGRLLTEVSLDTGPEDAAFQTQLELLHWRLFALEADEDWLAGATTLWTTVSATDGTSAAWQALLAGMLQDPLFLGY